MSSEVALLDPREEQQLGTVPADRRDGDREVRRVGRPVDEAVRES
jgi:hypothetical protein